MSPDATFVLAIAALAVAALTVGVSGWVLFVRDRRLARADVHPEAHEGS
jgi:hypothetical protein